MKHICSGQDSCSLSYNSYIFLSYGFLMRKKGEAVSRDLQLVTIVTSMFTVGEGGGGAEGVSFVDILGRKVGVTMTIRSQGCNCNCNCIHGMKILVPTLLYGTHILYYRQ